MNENKKCLKCRVYHLLDVDNRSIASKIVQGVIIAMILFSAFSLVLQSVSEYKLLYYSYFRVFDTISVTFFSIEYILRLWTITCDPRYAKPISGRIRYGFTFMQVIDLLAILPYFLSFVVFDLRVLRLLRVFRLLRIFRIMSYVRALTLIVGVLKKKAGELIITVIFLIFLLLIASSAMYYAENNAQPDSFPNIIASMWWAVITLTTVGYGDVYPITVIGKIIGGIIAIIGIGFFAFPTGILTSGFNEVIQEYKQRKEGEDEDDNDEKEKDKDEEKTCSACGQKKDN